MSQTKPVFKNSLLKALSEEDVAAFLPHLIFLKLDQRQMLYEPGEKIEYVYFVEEGVASLLATMEDGASVEVGMVGHEGMVGIPVVLGESVSSQRIVAQLPGSAYRMSATRCKELFEERPNVRKLFLPFLNSLIDTSTQTAACNRLHNVEQRMARWLLMSSDRVESDFLPLTHEYMASMLGVRRAGVTEAAGQLQRSGLIRYHHGRVTILDHKGLQATACECYASDAARFIRLLNARIS